MNNTLKIELIDVLKTLAQAVGTPLFCTHFGIKEFSELNDCDTLNQWYEWLVLDKVSVNFLKKAKNNLRLCTYVPKYAEFVEMCKPDYQYEFNKFLLHESLPEHKDKHLFNVSNQLFRMGVTKEHLTRDSQACFNAFKKAVDIVNSMSDEQLLSLPIKALRLEVDTDLNVEQLAKDKVEALANKIRMKIVMYNLQPNSNIQNGSEVMQYLFNNIDEPQQLIQAMAEPIIFDAQNILKAVDDKEEKEPQQLIDFKNEVKKQVNEQVYKSLFKPLKMRVIGNNTIHLIVKSNWQKQQISNNFTAELSKFKQFIGGYNFSLKVA
jgi:DnaA N-terminal domain